MIGKAAEEKVVDAVQGPTFEGFVGRCVAWALRFRASVSVFGFYATSGVCV